MKLIESGSQADAHMYNDISIALIIEVQRAPTEAAGDLSTGI